MVSDQPVATLAAGRAHDDTQPGLPGRHVPVVAQVPVSASAFPLAAGPRVGGVGIPLTPEVDSSDPRPCSSAGSSHRRMLFDSSSSSGAKRRVDYDETATISACSHSSGSCYSLDADVTHHFLDDGKEIVYVDQIHFPNGGYLEFSDVTIPGEGTDKKGNDQLLGRTCIGAVQRVRFHFVFFICPSRNVSTSIPQTSVAVEQKPQCPSCCVLPKAEYIFEWKSLYFFSASLLGRPTHSWILSRASARRSKNSVRLLTMTRRHLATSRRSRSAVTDSSRQ